MSLGEKTAPKTTCQLIIDTSDCELIKLTKEQMLMLEISLQDIEDGQIISHKELFDQEHKWLKKQ